MFLVNKGLNWSTRVIAQARNNYLFIPLLFAAYTGVFFCITMALDLHFKTVFTPYLPFQFSDTNTITNLLSVIAGSVITVAGVTFSITLLTVAHANSQIGPRLLSGFMENRTNQITLGVFLMTFCHGILTLSVIDEKPISILDHTLSNPPQLTLYAALLYSLMSVFVLVYFIHQIPKSIRMTHVVSHIGDELRRVTNNYFKKSTRPKTTNNQIQKQNDDHFLKTTELECQKTGYIQIINYQKLLEESQKEDYYIEISVNPGDFVFKNQVLLNVHSHKKITLEKSKNLLTHFAIDEDKSVEQDFTFGAHLLVEVAIRALSPGINDPYTACECIDQLKASLITLSRVAHPCNEFYGKKGKLRITRPDFNFEKFVNELLRPLIFYSSQDPLASRHLKHCFNELSDYLNKKEHQSLFEGLKLKLEKRMAKNLN